VYALNLFVCLKFAYEYDLSGRAAAVVKSTPYPHRQLDMLKLRLSPPNIFIWLPVKFVTGEPQEINLIIWATYTTLSGLTDLKILFNRCRTSRLMARKQ